MWDFAFFTIWMPGCFVWYESIPIRWDYLTSRHGRVAGRRRTADGRREPAEEVPSSKGKVDPEIGYGESRGKGTETTQTGQTG